MNELKNRGIGDILVAVVDGLKGFPEAINAVFPLTVIQTCIVHLIRHSLEFKDIRPSRQNWQRNWEHVVPFFAYPESVRRIIYTTNAIEALNAKLHWAVRARATSRMTTRR